MKIAIIYSHSAKKTSQVAKEIKSLFGSKKIEDKDVNSLDPEDLKGYDLLLLGAPSWFDGELPTYWDELVPAIEDVDFNGTKVAIFGNGNQVGYPENFGDAIGLLARVFVNSGASLIGRTAIEGYSFESSLALDNNEFLGLLLDFENQKNKNKSRIEEWVHSIKKLLKIN
jgi:flavodoxin I